MSKPAVIRTLDDLYSYFGSEPSYRNLNRRIYKDTACGASISLYGTLRGRPFAVHSGDDDPPKGFKADSFTVQTIVEGSDAEVNSDTFRLGQVTTRDLDEWLKYMEAEAEALWVEANEAD